MNTDATFRWRRRAAVTVLAGLVSVAGCTRSDGEREAAWAILATTDRAALTSALRPGDGGTGRVPASTVQVSLAGCEPTKQYFVLGTCYLSLDALNRYRLHVDEEDAAELTARATVIFRGEHVAATGEVRPLGRFGTTEVGPLRFGQTIDIAFGGGGATDPILEGFALADGTADEYRIRVSVSGCQVSNNSACGNGRRDAIFTYRAPNDTDVGSTQQGLEADGSPTSTTSTTPPTSSPPDAAAPFTLPVTLAGLQGSPTLFQREGEDSIDFQDRQQAELGFLDSIAQRLSLRELVASRYIGGAQDHTILGVHPPHNVILYAGRHVEPATDSELAASADTLLATAFEATFVAEPDGAQVTYGPARRYDAGSPALHVSCAITTTTAPGLTLQHPVCGWVDQHTVGLIQGTTIVNGSEPTAEQAEAQTARLVTALRAGLPPIP